MTLTLSTDRKTANLASPNGKTAKIKNAFGLPSGTNFSCPGATSVCEKICYAGKLEKVFPGFRKSMLSNWEALQGKSIQQMVGMIDPLIVQFEKDCEKWGAEKYFRIHHDGDFFSLEYAFAWAQVMLMHPAVNFWVYTRSFVPALNVVSILAPIPNLSLYLSVDADNGKYAEDVIAEFPNVRIAALAETFTEAGDVIAQIRDDNKPGAKCPELTKQIPLITKAGGACFSCMLCPQGKADIRFAFRPNK